MPFSSQAQRRLMYAARKNPSVRKKYDINLSAVEKMIAHDEGGKLPEKVRKKKRRKARG